MRRPDVKRFLSELEPDEVDEWEAFDALEPIGTDRLYELMAAIGSSICGSQGMDVPAEKFLYWLEKEERENTAEEDLAVCRAAALSANGI